MNSDLLAQVSRSALEKETFNVIEMVRRGKTLTSSQRRLLERRAGWLERDDIVQALNVMRESCCEDCATLVDRLLENIGV